ncbi:uncharacterized protein LOC119271547 [Triticum dicoccoides]|uniref:uncharacterized protein LOC119271547 n=1 Tax=Triticum dicoccoides TaxID=85692 RepID=UPI0018908860|nr:uncharacterized protein LOC119271547 [Triticum dicoccoides]
MDSRPWMSPPAVFPSSPELPQADPPSLGHPRPLHRHGRPPGAPRPAFPHLARDLRYTESGRIPSQRQVPCLAASLPLVTGDPAQVPATGALPSPAPSQHGAVACFCHASTQGRGQRQVPLLPPASTALTSVLVSIWRQQSTASLATASAKAQLASPRLSLSPRAAQTGPSHIRSPSPPTGLAGPQVSIMLRL